MCEANVKASTQPSPEAIGEAQEIILEMRHQVERGEKPWALALLEAISRWRLPQEEVRGHTYRYLIANEAFDWLLLAQRLALELMDIVPQEEIEALLFRGRPPLELTEEEFRSLIGDAKYRAHLNFFYGVIVEEAIQLAVHDEVAKERLANVWENKDIDDEVFIRIYGETRPALWNQFLAAHGLPPRDWLDVEEKNEFTYWLFKERLKRCDLARVASDTRKGLRKLAQLNNRPPISREAGAPIGPPSR